MYMGLWVAVWFLGNVLLVGAFDIYVLFFLPEQQTVSYWVQHWLKEFPVLGIALGVVIGHMAWPIGKAAAKGGP